MLGAAAVLAFRLLMFGLFSYPEQSCWGQASSLNLNGSCLRDTLHTQPEGNFIQHVYYTWIFIVIGCMKSGVEFSTCDISWGVKGFRFGSVWILKLQIEGLGSYASIHKALGFTS